MARAAAASLPLILLATGAAEAATVPSAFFIGKSENRNEVHFAVQATDACALAGSEPVYPYWRMRERGAKATEPLLGHEHAAYGLVSQRVVREPSGESRVELALRAVPQRTVTVRLRRSEGRCVADATTRIGGAPARLTRVFVTVGFLVQVRSVDLHGVRADGSPVVETLRP
jgi:hypothetical protein